ncbi:acetyltransferase [Neobacillus drentensis]|uniref:acetyltransferase n=1 Tax=Neobacillus drentensis TaxID=220684 RepID=UPI002FFE7CB6
MKIVLVGHGGHSKVVTDAILSNKECDIVGYLDDKYKNVELIDNTYCGPISSAIRLVDYFYDVSFVITIGNNKVRQSIVDILNLPEKYFPAIIHDSAVISPSSRIGCGTVVMPNAVINASTIIGNHVIINTGCIIEHDSVVGDYSHISPGVSLTGNVKIGEGVLVGAGSTIIPNKEIGNWSIIGAGATVLKDIPSFSTAVGIPARIIKKNRCRGEEIAKYNL